MEQYEDWGLEKQLSFLRNHYQDLSLAAKRILLCAPYESDSTCPRSAFGDLTEEELQAFCIPLTEWSIECRSDSII